MNQSQNVRNLLKTKKIFIKDINETNRIGKDRELKVKTNLLALLYCTYAEAVLYQIVLTPYGITKSQIEDIDNESSVGTIWKKLINIGFKMIPNYANSNDLKQREGFIINFIDDFIVPPSLIRNKMMHGQWVVALNRNRTKLNNETTINIDNLDYVKIGTWFKSLETVSKIVRELIQSPTKGFHNSYWPLYLRVREDIEKSKNWTYLSKRNLLKNKPKK